ncbi:MAG: hypothetical protein GY788_04585 [bacterium]|nr:hypothetical protein [bacterium]
MTALRFLVVADSHIRFPDDDVITYPSNALMVDRNRRVVELCNELDAEFVVHLGDIVHPLPVESGHEPAVQLAVGIYEGLEPPIYFVAGNHDIGDKPNAMVAVPAVAEENYAVFEKYWGPAFQSFDRADCHFVVLDTSVLNSDLARETTQRLWLEQDVRTAADEGKRVFLFTHYPPFVRSAGEGEHYDNLGEPARSWLLGLAAEHGVEAIFSGHVHNFLYNHHLGTELYVLPSTGFVRPDYSELAAVAPESEGGRDDPAKLGFFVVDVESDGHQVRPIRTNGAVDSGPIPDVVSSVAIPGWQSPLGVTLRHGWMSPVDFPTAGLDEFRRKTVRNDAILLDLWEARINKVRIPVEDVANQARLAHLHERGFRFTVRSAGVPEQRAIAAVRDAQDSIARWELVLWPHQLEAALGALDGVAGLILAVSAVVPIGGGDAAVHHFVTSGFATDAHDEVARMLAVDVEHRVQEIGFRIGPDEVIETAAAAGQQLAAASGRRALINVELPRGGENTCFDDDAVIADRTEEAVRGALGRPEVALFLDGFVDHDRGYYPRNGLVDRRYNPRPALQRLVEVASS